MINSKELANAADGAIWIHSDLQIDEPETARACLLAAVEDVASLNPAPQAVWCLGDCLMGHNLERLGEVAAGVVSLLERLGLPIFYVMGNHEMDLRRKGTNRYPLFEMAAERKMWRTMPRLSDAWFEHVLFGCRIIFLGDHADPDGSWWTSHGKVIEERPGAYPYRPCSYERLRRSLADSERPVIIASHYAFPGGQRPAPLMRCLLPLPSTVLVHLHGHAHIGDTVYITDADPWVREHPIEAERMVRQYNISALENVRTPGIHSGMLEFRGGRPARLRIRCHEQREWMDSFRIQTRDGSVSAPAVARP